MIPTGEQLILALDLVLYEIWMLDGSLRLWSLDFDNVYPTETARILRNLRVEATLIHVRILLDFFETPTNDRKHDDILAEDFSFPEGRVLLSDETRSRLNKDLAHLTYDRLQRRSDQEKEWDCRWFRPLLERCQEFLAAQAVTQVAEEAQNGVRARLAGVRSNLANILKASQT